MSGRKEIKFKIYSRCSPAGLSDIIDALDDQRLELVNEMGFKGLEKLKIEKTNRPLGAWLLSNFDPISGCINAGTTSELKLTCQDINLVLGIPWEGKDIVPASQKEVATMKQYLCHVFQKKLFDQITIHAIQRILYRRPSGQMSPDEVVQFKTAFIIYAVTKLLAPLSLCNYISSHYMKPLVDIDNIKNYNWANFVFYLDNLDIGSNNPSHDCLPQISSYDDKIVAQFVKSDMILQTGYPFPSFGKLKLRDGRFVCYTRKTNTSDSKDHEVVKPASTARPRPSVIDAIEPPSFSLGLSQDDIDPDMGEPSTHDRQLGSKTLQHGATANPIPHVIDGIDPPSFDLGVSQDDYDPDVEELSPRLQGDLKAKFDEVADPDVVPDTPPCRQGLSKKGSKPAATTFTSPHSILKEVSNLRIEMREQLRVTKYQPTSKRRIIGSPSDLLADFPARGIKPSKSVKSPFLSKQTCYRRHNCKAMEDLYMSTISHHDEDSLRKIWVHISNPVPMTLNLGDIQHTLQIHRPMPEETFNVAVQVLHEDELHMFGSTEFFGWRHFLNQDFAMYAIADSGHWNPAAHIHFFTDETFVPYNVSTCRLIFIPIHHSAHYSLYAFDMDTKTISILDPVRDTSFNGKDVQDRHTNTKLRISKALQECLQLAFPDFNEQITSWQTKYPTSIIAQCNDVDSAFHVLNYMKNWNGMKLANIVALDPLSLRKEFLLTLLSFKSNEAILPEPVGNFIRAACRR
ncbi:hypothetical protein BS78_05G126000 [Paspalum vaginatum]|nr:hypothetical protein BS78_05G126000 [Paspalum vaginatum]